MKTERNEESITPFGALDALERLQRAVRIIQRKQIELFQDEEKAMIRTARSAFFRACTEALKRSESLTPQMKAAIARERTRAVRGK
jgi:hypothetical protein